MAKSSRMKSFTFTDMAKGAGTHEEACDETSLLGLTTNEDVPVEADSVPLIPVSVNEPHVPNHEEFSTLDVMNSGLNTSVTYQELMCERLTNSSCVKSFSAVAKAAGTHEEICDDTSSNRGTTNVDDHALECDETPLLGQDMNEDVPDAVEANSVPLFLSSVNDPTVLDYESTDTSNRAHDGGIMRKVDATVNQKVNCFNQNEDVCGEGVDCLNPISVAESCYRSKQMPGWNITEGCLDGASDTALAGNASRGAFKYEWDLNVSDCDDSNVSSSIEYTSESPSKTASIEERQYKFDLNSIPVDDDSQSSDGWRNHYMDNPTLAALFLTKQPWPASNLFTESPSSNTNGVESSNGSSDMNYSSITSGTEYVGTSVPTLGSSSCTTWMMKRKETDWAFRPCSSKRQQRM